MRCKNILIDLILVELVNEIGNSEVGNNRRDLFTFRPYGRGVDLKRLLESYIESNSIIIRNSSNKAFFKVKPSHAIMKPLRPISSTFRTDLPRKNFH